MRVGNQSQNWSRAVIDVGVGYQEDLARVQRVLREIAHDLWEDEEYKDVIIEEPEVTGVEMLAADSVTLRVMVKTAPLEQWGVARALRQRIKARFDHEGIEIPFAQRGDLAPRGQAGGRGGLRVGRFDRRGMMVA
ncbi:mechanosensitive ion channel family protein [Nocardioides sp. TF02-7]|uniref:mechanosensitive ion channel family protein n=1 Tax=Nocardioides sp. TF02-7 TaxID=2917724 RepID=UPI001F053222|nr:mechanosensitive ion channel family protein [Nocardioides sp. TF02-7]UMG91699.1 mechanosensitive ion channel family protein [Nocardioides sp. TF02-7]